MSNINITSWKNDLDLLCKGTIDHFKKELAKIRSGRATTGILESVTVEYYGSKVPLQQMGIVNSPEPRQLLIQVFDSSAVEAVEKAIRDSGLGFNPSREGSAIRIQIPALTEERKKEFVKKLHKLAEDNRIAVRNHRREAIDLFKAAEKKKQMTEDEVRRGQEDVQKITDKFVSEIDALLASKEKEILE